MPHPCDVFVFVARVENRKPNHARVPQVSLLRPGTAMPLRDTPEPVLNSSFKRYLARGCVRSYTASSCEVVNCVYRCVVDNLSCPSSSCGIARKSAPSSSRMCAECMPQRVRMHIGREPTCENRDPLHNPPHASRRQPANPRRPCLPNPRSIAGSETTPALSEPLALKLRGQPRCPFRQDTREASCAAASPNGTSLCLVSLAPISYLRIASWFALKMNDLFRFSSSRLLK